MMLLEENFDQVQVLTEASDGGKKLYLQGVMSEAGTKNRNGRVYSSSDLQVTMNQINDAAKANRHILGECDHPSTLEIKLENVSHKIVEASMDGNILNFKAEVLGGTPKGAILESLLRAGVTVGVSTRGSGQVNESTGEVKNFRFITLDAVATPSCQQAYPTTLEEQLAMYSRGEVVTDLSEAIMEDSLAQRYFQIEMERWIKETFVR